MLRAILALGSTFLVSGGKLEPAVEAEAQARPVVERFYAAVLRCGVRKAAKPTLRSEMARGVIHYDGNGSIVIFQ